MVVWCGLVLAVTGCVLAAGLAALVPLVRRVGGLREFVHRCHNFLPALQSDPWAAAAAGAGLLIIVRIVGTAVLSWRRQTRAARCLASSYRAGSERRPAMSDLLICPETRPAVFSVAAGWPRIIATSGAVDQLSDQQMAAAIAHEQAHLRGRHHLLLKALDVARAALPCPLTTLAGPAVRELIEMRADDAAAAERGSAVVVEALLRLTGATPSGALAASGTAVLSRVHRLVEPAAPQTWPSRLSVAATATVVLVPMAAVLAMLPALVAHFCPPAL